jgi:hypothetical protein
MHTRTRKWSLVLPALAVAGFILAGCTKPDPEVTYFTGGPTEAETVTAAPTTEAPSDPMQTSRDEARNAYLNYAEVRNAVALDYFRDWEDKFLSLTTGDEGVAVVANWSVLAEQGYHMQGAIVMKTSPEILEYDDADPMGNYRAELKVCVDTSDVELVAEGKDTRRAYPDGRFYYTVVMQRVVNYDAEDNVIGDPHGQGWWRVASDQGDPERPC